VLSLRRLGNDCNRQQDRTFSLASMICISQLGSRNCPRSNYASFSCLQTTTSQASISNRINEGRCTLKCNSPPIPWAVLKTCLHVRKHGLLAYRQIVSRRKNLVQPAFRSSSTKTRKNTPHNFTAGTFLFSRPSKEAIFFGEPQECVDILLLSLLGSTHPCP
jgi:hypothetical protein